MNHVIVSGTGTGIGKTHLSQALLLARGEHAPTIGWKPVESGTVGDVGSDQRLLWNRTPKHARRGSSPLGAHVALKAPLSPHLAAEREGRELPWDTWVQYARTQHAVLGDSASLLVELAGGLFSPLTVDRTCADLVRDLLAEFGSRGSLVLCAPDRLGVLHEVRSTLLAATASGIPTAVVVLMAPEVSDDATGTNRAELERTLARVFPEVRIVGPVPRGSCEELSADPCLEELVRLLDRSGFAPPP